MNRRPASAARSRGTLRRSLGAIVRDAADVAGAPLVELLLPRDAPGPRWESAAFAAPDLDRAARAELARELARSPALAELPEPLARVGHRVASCEPALARILGRGRQQAFLRVGAERSALGWLRIVLDGRPGREALRRYRAIARQAAGRLDAEALRRELAARHRLAARDVTREKHALAELSQAKDTLRALSLAGAHLMVETDGAAICAVICRELIGLGFHSAVLVAEAGAVGPRPPYRFAHTSFSPPVQRATERILGRSLAELSVPATAALVARAEHEGRAVYRVGAREAARQLFGATGAQIRRLARLLGLRQVVVAPLRAHGGAGGLLVVATARLRRSDPEAIDAFALQASIALEKARLFGELREHQSRLESEVERRTLELTRAVRALKEIDRRKDNFLANVSHELRTPLVTVLGYADLLVSEKLGPLAPRQGECLRVVASSARRLRSFIDELLEFSRYELTRERLALAPVPAGELLQQAALAMAPRFHERGLTLRARVARGTPPIWGDRDRLHQVLVNLLSNAERHCPTGTRVRLAAARGQGGVVALAVRDDGPGIPPEHLERIFDRLYQVGDALPPREGAGLGLGLAIVKSIVDAHGGRVVARSTPGRGTLFRLALPAAGEAPPAAGPALGSARS